MKIIIDTELDEIIVPDKFYENVDKLNAMLVKNGGNAKEYQSYVKDAFESAFAKPWKRKSDTITKRGK